MCQALTHVQSRRGPPLAGDSMGAAGRARGRPLPTRSLSNQLPRRSPPLGPFPEHSNGSMESSSIEPRQKLFI